MSDFLSILNSHDVPNSNSVVATLNGPTETNAKGYPIISAAGFNQFLKDIPHLFHNGHRLLTALNEINDISYLSASQKLATKVLMTVCRTAAITSPSDLWILREVLQSHKQLGSLAALETVGEISCEELAAKFQLDPQFLQHDLDFLVSRLYLKEQNGRYSLIDSPQEIQTIHQLEIIPESWPRERVKELSAALTAKKFSPELEKFLSVSIEPCSDRETWAPDLYEIEVGYRLTPLVLALRFLNLSQDPDSQKILTHLGDCQPAKKLLNQAGVIIDDQITPLGKRILQRGPGPMGIVYAYHQYMQHHVNLLKGNKGKLWVSRGENVAASQDANAKTFKLANDKLDLYCENTGFNYRVYIEHAVGQGEATRQRLLRNGEADLQYVGADLEKDAIDKALEQQSHGKLPTNMRFVAGADIGDPNYLLEKLSSASIEAKNAVMIVGNGFHEVRDQSNEKMVQIFKDYCQAGILLIFTEESGLLNEDLIATAWNTYHAGFRYVHAISGQGLRPANDRDNAGAQRYSWKKCASLAGYEVLEDYCSRTRRIYPHPKKNGYNPAISVSYFCVPPA